MIKDYFKFYPTDIDFHAQISKNIESNPFDKDDSRYIEWQNSFYKYHKDIIEEKDICCG